MIRDSNSKNNLKKANQEVKYFNITRTAIKMEQIQMLHTYALTLFKSSKIT